MLNLVLSLLVLISGCFCWVLVLYLRTRFQLQGLMSAYRLLHQAHGSLLKRHCNLGVPQRVQKNSFVYEGSRVLVADLHNN